jgi:sulfocyanin
MKSLFLPSNLTLPLFSVCAAAGVFQCQTLKADDAQKPPAAAHAGAHEGMGLKRELIEGITPADFLRLSDKPKTVRITLVATYSTNNYGMNFNGFSYGKAVYRIPAGWNVEATFINPSPVPHSAVVVERDQVKKLQVGEPAFKGGATPSANTGISSNKASFQFTADEPGDYAFACGFPSHALAGHWIALEVGANVAAPTLQLGEEAPVQASAAK